MVSSQVNANEMSLIQDIQDLALEVINRNGNCYITEGSYALAIDNCERGNAADDDGGLFHCRVTFFGWGSVRSIGPLLGRLGFERDADSEFGPEFSATCCVSALQNALFDIIAMSIGRGGALVTDFELNSVNSERRAMDTEVYKFSSNSEEGDY
jgi:hypothetical protein